MKLVWPSTEHLLSYQAALEAGWCANTSRGAAAGNEELAEIAADPRAFLASQVLRQPDGETVTLPDGSKAPRLPGYRRWLWDGEFCGMIGLRWQAGTQELPPHCLGHIGYSIVPWKQRLGYATSALAQLLPEARAEGLLYVELTTSQRTQVGGASSRRTAVFWLSTSLSPFNTALHRVCATVLPSYEREI